MRNNYHYDKRKNYENKFSKNSTKNSDYTKALEENKRLKMVLNQKNNILNDYNSRIRLLQEELNKIQNNNSNNGNKNSNNYQNSLNNNFLYEGSLDNPFQSNNFINLFFDDILPNNNIRVINHNFNPGDYEDYYEDKNINGTSARFNFIENDDSKAEQEIIEQLYPDPDKMTYEQLLELEEKVGNVSKGLNKAQIKKIPRFIYQKNLFKGIDNKCVVCQYEFKNGENITKLTCGHIFHTDCVDTWLSKNKICPMCQKEIIIK